MVANNTCVSAVHTNILRVSRLTSTGHLDAGASNLYISDQIIEIVSTPVYAADTDLEQQNGAGNVCASFAKDGDYKRHDLTMSLCSLDAELLEMLSSATVITSAGNTIGAKFGTDPNTGYACLEAWQDVVEDGATTGEFIHWVWPKCQFKRGQTTRNNGLQVIPLTGKAFINRNVGLGPAGDWPVVLDEPDSFYVDTAMPAAQCGYQTASVGS